MVSGFLFEKLINLQWSLIFFQRLNKMCVRVWIAR